MALSRREFLKLGSLGLAAAMLARCQSSTATSGSSDIHTEPQPKSTSVERKYLDELLLYNQERDRAMGLPRGRTGHVPMVLIALYQMGAPKEKMQAYFESKGGRFHGDASTDPFNDVNRDNWKQHLGNYAAFRKYAAFFSDWEQADGLESVLKSSLSPLMKGVAGHAFHPLIRLGYALDYGNRDEICWSLAYLAATYHPSPDYDKNAAAVPPGDMLQTVVTKVTPLNIDLAGGIEKRIGAVYALKEFSESLKPVQFSDSRPLDDISRLILEVFSRNNDFTLLHALTSCQALRITLPYLSGMTQSLSEYWHAICATYITIAKTLPEFDKDVLSKSATPWDAVFSTARASDNEHTIKLAYSCWLESQHYERDTYLDLANRECHQNAVFR